MTLSIIVALAADRAIGLDNHLLYRLPDDMKHFRRLTTGHTVIMGRRTYESLPKGALPDRRNIVLSHSLTAAQCPGCDVYGSLDTALADCRARSAAGDTMAQQVFVIGGASVYAEALKLADRLCLTLIHDTPAAADTFFPDISPTRWHETRREEHAADDRHAVPFAFVEMERLS